MALASSEGSAQGSVGVGGAAEDSSSSRRTSTAFPCEECGRVFRRRSNLSRHERRHSGERPFQCPQCHRPFAHHSSLQHHLRLHSGERPYQCAVCLRTFRQRPNYSLHLKTHTGEKRFRCPACGKEFAQRVHLTTHARLHSGDLPYECEDCGRRFSQRCHLTRHRGTPAGHPAHVCSLCGRKFVSQSCLSAHLQRIHGGVLQRTHRGGTQCGDKEEEEEEEDKRRKTQREGGGKNAVKAKMECEVCHKNFRKLSHLRHHRYTHTGERPYPCPQCGRRFSEAGSLRRHMTSHIRAHLSLSSPPLTHTPTTTHSQEGISPLLPTNQHHSSPTDTQESQQDTPENPHNSNTSGKLHGSSSEDKIQEKCVSYIPREFEGYGKTDKGSPNYDKEGEERTSVTQSCSSVPQPFVAVSLFLFGKRVKEEVRMEEGEEMSVKEEVELIEEAV